MTLPGSPCTVRAVQAAPGCRSVVPRDPVSVCTPETLSPGDHPPPGMCCSRCSSSCSSHYRPGALLGVAATGTGSLTQAVLPSVLRLGWCTHGMKTVLLLRRSVNIPRVPTGPSLHPPQPVTHKAALSAGGGEGPTLSVGPPLLAVLVQVGGFR